MRVFQTLDEIEKPFSNAVITIGNFDGVHVGHQALFSEVIKRASEIGGAACAMTFEPHPLRFLKTKNPPPLITLYEHKVELIAEAGIENLVCVPFTAEFAEIEPETFVKDVLIDRLGVNVLVVGPDYGFGRGRKGTVEFLQNLSRSLPFEVVVLPWIAVLGPDGERVSSTSIRNLLQEGEVAHAARLLGRPYQVRARVVPGRKRGGAVLGFPTANIVLTDEICPAAGVYAVVAAWNGCRYNGVANIGVAPTFGDGLFTVEVHLLGFSGDLYGHNITVDFMERLRGEIRFDGIEALSAQINRDIERAREILDAG